MPIPITKRMLGFCGMAIFAICVVILLLVQFRGQTKPSEQVTINDLSAVAAAAAENLQPNASNLNYVPRRMLDSSGYTWVVNFVEPWPEDFSFKEIGAHFIDSIRLAIQKSDALIENVSLAPEEQGLARYTRASLLNYEGDPVKAYSDLAVTRKLIEKDTDAALQLLYTIIYYQGISALRQGENENCIMCRGESSCILPISRSAIHQYPEGSRTAIKHFTEYLDQFPDDLEVKWLLNVSHMTLGEYPHRVNPKYIVKIDDYLESEFDIGKFRDIGHLVGLNRLNQAGGGIMEDFDNDGRLDVVVSSTDPTEVTDLYLNNGLGKFENWTEKAGLTEQLGGLNCVQTDFNNDGFKDVLIVRGAWFPATLAMRPSLLKNNGNGTFTDVTAEAGMDTALNSIAASWADYDNDGWLDVFICCEQQRNRLYHNLGNGTFEEVAIKARLQGEGKFHCKGASWIDFDNDGWQDLFVTHLSKLSNNNSQLFRNNRDGTFTKVTKEMGVNGPPLGFACWAWDYNNDGWQDIFATSYSRSVENCVKGLMGEPHPDSRSVLLRNRLGQGFEDVTEEVGLDKVYITMGSNFADFDNDGFLDMYLGTGDPSLGTLVPNRMFRSVEAQRFADITVSSGTGHLQKGHGVACGDWDRDGNVDLFIQMGGTVNGDKYHNILFQNPGHDNDWITVKLIGKKTNNAAIGARIKVVIGGEIPRTIYRHVSSGSSFGANPLEQTIGLGKADKIDALEITWPTSGTTQVFRYIPSHTSIEITEFAPDFKTLSQPRIQLP